MPAAAGPNRRRPAPAQTEIPPSPRSRRSSAASPRSRLVVGAGDENGTRLKLNLETPSLNSFVYEYMAADLLSWSYTVSRR